MYSNERHLYRQAFFNAWEKYCKHLPLEPVEQQLIEIILLHPEYQGLLQQSKSSESQEYELADNPFLHLSLHLAIQDQLRLNRPQGIVECYQALLQRDADTHHVIHLMMECLAQTLWEAQQLGKQPDERIYLEKLKLL